MSEGEDDGVDFELPERFVSPSPRPPVAPVSARPKADDLPRLNGIKQSAMFTIPWDVPDTWRARVVADLEDFVTTRQFPAHLPPWETSRIARARVLEVIQPFRDQEAAETARKAAQQQAAQRITTLRTHGATYATQEMAAWDWSDQAEARRLVSSELEVKVKADWSERDVQRVVDDVLSDWDDDDEEPES